MITTYHNISFGTQTVPEQIPVVQGDTGREIVFILTDFTIPEGATATYYVQKPSGEAVYNTATISENNIIVPLTAQSIIEVGENDMQVRVILGEDIVTSFRAILMVRPFLGIGAVESTTEMNIFDQAVEAAKEEFQTEAEAIAEEVIESIPEDYTALSNEVNDLKTDITDSILETVGVNVFDSSNVLSNTAINSSGATISATGFYVSKPIPVYPKAVYEITDSLGSTAYLNLAFYDKSGTYISGATSGVDKVFTAPNNAVFARVCGSAARIANQSLICSNLPSVDYNILSTCISGVNGDNLFNPNNTTEGIAFNSSGATTTNSAVYISDYIPIIPNGIYKIGLSINSASFSNAVVYNNKKQIVALMGGTSKEVIAPSSGCYIRVSGLIANKNGQTLEYINPANTLLDTKYAETVNALVENDLFISGDATTGKFFNTVGNITDNEAGYISDYIRVIPNAEYVILQGVQSASSINAVIYDSEKNKLTTGGIIDGLTTRITIPTNGAYIRLNGVLSFISQQGFFLIPYNFENVCAGKKCICFGDSLTEYDGRQFTTGAHAGETCVGFESYMRSDLKMSKVNNRGGSGMTTPAFVERLLDEISSVADYDYMTIMGGDNDDRLDVSVGTISAIGSTFDTTTVYGALQEAIEQTLTVNPLIRIVMMTEPIGWTGRTVDGEEKLVRVQEIYPQAYRDVAVLYGLPLIDLWKTSGINEFNRNDLYADVSDATNVTYMYHPYNNGWKRISQLICMAFRHFR